MLQARPLLAVCLVLLAGLDWLAGARDVPLVEPADAARWEGQTVRMQGWVLDTKTSGGFSQWTLAADGHSIPVQATPASAAEATGSTPGVGSWSEAEGRLTRWNGRLTLMAEHLVHKPEPTPATVSLAQLAQAPLAWLGLPVRVQANLSGQDLQDGPTTLRLLTTHALSSPSAAGQQLWSGHLVYATDCACYALQTVDPWTS